ncbi:MAG: hypothetical protein M3Q53_00430 [Actinomycetota bacterium]|nr:hypothetical protein [Actinomycetota bacterium]
MGRFSISTALAASAMEIWEQVCTFEGVNYELGPYLRMTKPPGLRGRSLDVLAPGSAPGRSWLLLGGVLPVDYDDLGIAELEPPRRFLERSRMLSMAAWEHERVVEPAGESACTVTDRLAYELRDPLARAPGADALADRMVAATFRHRHQRLVVRHDAAQPR